MTMQPTVGTRLDQGGWHNATLPTRWATRHGWAEQIELPRVTFDNCPHPYTNWGHANRLAFILHLWKDAITKQRRAS